MQICILPSIIMHLHIGGTLRCDQFTVIDHNIRICCDAIMIFIVAGNRVMPFQPST